MTASDKDRDRDVLRVEPVPPPHERAVDTATAIEREREHEREQLENVLGWFAANCGCEGHQILRDDWLEKIRAPDWEPMRPRVFAPAPPRDPDEPPHTHHFFDMRSVIDCEGCQWGVRKAIEYWERHPDRRPEWMSKLTRLIEEGPQP
jgi:hypothetical protein